MKTEKNLKDTPSISISKRLYLHTLYRLIQGGFIFKETIYKDLNSVREGNSYANQPPSIGGRTANVRWPERISILTSSSSFSSLLPGLPIGSYWQEAKGQGLQNLQRQRARRVLEGGEWAWRGKRKLIYRPTYPVGICNWVTIVHLHYCSIFSLFLF